jgi:Spy/CpxP family protein refolding chaperone
MVMKGKTRIWIGMALIFISGIAIGFFGAGAMMRKNVRRFMQKGPAHMNARVVRHAIRGMELTDAQRAEIDSIMTETTPELRRLSTSFADSLETVATGQFDRIKAVLDEEQVKVLEERIQRFRDRFRRHREGRHDRRPGGRRRHDDPPPGG